MDRRKTLEAFASYVNQYDSKDPKISLKIKHTYKVAELCEKIGRCSWGLQEMVWMQRGCAVCCMILADLSRFGSITPL